MKTNNMTENLCKIRKFYTFSEKKSQTYKFELFRNQVCYKPIWTYDGKPADESIWYLFNEIKFSIDSEFFRFWGRFGFIISMTIWFGRCLDWLESIWIASLSIWILNAKIKVKDALVIWNFVKICVFSFKDIKDIWDLVKIWFNLRIIP